MTKYPMTKEIRMPNDEVPTGKNRGEDQCEFDVSASSFEFRHSFVIGYFVIRNS